MRARLKLKPGQKGTKKLVEEYGERLVCVRYRYDEATKKRYKTAEIIVDEADWVPRPRAGGHLVGVRIAWREEEMWRKVKAAGGRWDEGWLLWILPYSKVVRLGLVDRIRKNAFDSKDLRQDGGDRLVF